MRHHDDPALVRLRAAVVAAPTSDGPRLAYADGLAAHGFTGLAKRIRNSVKNPNSKVTRTLVPGSSVTRVFEDTPVVLSGVWTRGFLSALLGRWESARGYLPYLYRTYPIESVTTWDFSFGTPGTSWTWSSPGASTWPYGQDVHCAWVLGPQPGTRIVYQIRNNGYDMISGSIARCLVPYELFSYWPDPPSAYYALPSTVRYATQKYACDTEFAPWPLAAWAYPSKPAGEAAFQTAVRRWALAQPVTHEEEKAIHAELRL